jgi:hypothetical protein
MKACLTVLGLCAISWLFQAWAVEPTEAERKLLSDLRAFAEKGDAAAQNDLGWAFSEGLFGLKGTSENL